MSRRGLAAAAAAACILVSAGAHAASLITYVSAGGTDSGTCTQAAPCRTLSFAIGATAGKGEIHVLSAGSYGVGATINKSLTIFGEGNSLVGTSIIINAPGLPVTLRNLVLDGHGLAQAGIDVLNGGAAALHLEGVTVAGFKSGGLLLNGADAQITITDSTFRDNTGNGASLSGSSLAKITIDNSRFEANTANGLTISSAAATVTNSIASGNGGAGFAVNASGTMMLERATASGNTGTGLTVFSNGTARISNSTFVQNGTGVANNGTVFTRQNNTVTGNTTQLSGSALLTFGGT